MATSASTPRLDQPVSCTPDRRPVVAEIIDWYQAHQRSLPWREPDRTPWGVLVSEVMLQQTPVARVLPVWQQWLQRWPTPDDLADEPTSAAVAAWGRLGYPRRALRLHAAATAIAADYGGQVPSDYHDLLALPGIGDYTAAAVASFAFGQRHLVLDTNVRRVISRLAQGQEFPATSPTRAERSVAAGFLPDQPDRAAVWAVASMELGALICTARSPQCQDCPVRSHCQWLATGRPAHADQPGARPRTGQPWQGTDRQCRGQIIQTLRDHPDGVDREALLDGWPHGRRQAESCLRALASEGLISVDGTRARL